MTTTPPPPAEFVETLTAGSFCPFNEAEKAAARYAIDRWESDRLARATPTPEPAAGLVEEVAMAIQTSMRVAVKRPPTDPEPAWYWPEARAAIATMTARLRARLESDEVREIIRIAVNRSAAQHGIIAYLFGPEAAAAPADGGAHAAAPAVTPPAVGMTRSRDLLVRRFIHQTEAVDAFRHTLGRATERLEDDDVSGGLLRAFDEACHLADQNEPAPTPAASAPAEVTEAEVEHASRVYSEAHHVAYQRDHTNADEDAEYAMRAALEAFVARRPPAPTAAPVALDREALGRRVRTLWVDFARQQPNPKPHHVAPWEDLDEPNREVDRIIGETLTREAVEWAFAAVMAVPYANAVGPATCIAEARKALRVPVSTTEPRNILEALGQSALVKLADEKATAMQARAEKAEADLATATKRAEEAEAVLTDVRRRLAEERRRPVAHLPDPRTGYGDHDSHGTLCTNKATQDTVIMEPAKATCDSCLREHIARDALRARPAVPDEVVALVRAVRVFASAKGHRLVIGDMEAVVSNPEQAEAARALFAALPAAEAALSAPPSPVDDVIGKPDCELGSGKHQPGCRHWSAMTEPRCVVACSSVLNGYPDSPCNQPAGHDSSHRDVDGVEWDDDQARDAKETT